MELNIKAPRIPWLFSMIVLAVVVIILVLGYAAFKNTEATAFREYNQRQLMIARGAAEGIETCKNHLNGELNTLRRLAVMENLSPEAMNKVIENLYKELKSWGLKCISLLDEKGNPIYSAGEADDEEGEYCNRDFLSTVKTRYNPNGNGENLPLHTCIVECLGVHTGRQALQVVVPIEKEGRLWGYIYCCQWLNFLTSKFVAWAHNTPGGHTFLIDNKSHDILWAPDLSLIGRNLMKESEGYPELQQLLRDFSAMKPGLGEYKFRSYDESRGRFVDRDESVLAAFQPVTEGDEEWMVVAWSSKEVARRSIRSVYIRHLILVVLSIVVIAGAYIYSLRIHSRVSRRLEREVSQKTSQLAESRKRLLTILDNLNVAVYAADIETHDILFANKYIHEIYGEVEGKKCWEVFHQAQSGPCAFCSNPELLARGELDEELGAREFHNTASGLWHERRERVIRWVDGSIVRLEIAMNTPCEHLIDKQPN